MGFPRSENEQDSPNGNDKSSKLASIIDIDSSEIITLLEIPFCDGLKHANVFPCVAVSNSGEVVVQKDSLSILCFSLVDYSMRTLKRPKGTIASIAFVRHDSTLEIVIYANKKRMDVYQTDLASINWKRMHSVATLYDYYARKIKSFKKLANFNRACDLVSKKWNVDRAKAQKSLLFADTSISVWKSSPAIKRTYVQHNNAQIVVGENRWSSCSQNICSVDSCISIIVPLQYKHYRNDNQSFAISPNHEFAIWVAFVSDRLLIGRLRIGLFSEK